MRRATDWTRLLFVLAAALALGACAPAAEEEPAAGETPMEEATAMEPGAEPGAPTCDDPLGCVEIAPDEPVHVAGIFVLSGANESLGVDSRNGVEIAIDDFGQIHGHDILFTSEDGGCTPEGGQAAASRVTADTTVVGIIGTSCSSEAEAAIPIVTNAGMVMISSSNTAPRLTDQARGDDYASYLRTAHNDQFQGRVAAEFAYNELGLTTAATIHDGSPYAEQLQAVFAEVFQELGGTITAQEAVNVGDTDMRPVLTSIAAGAPEILYYPVFTAEGGFITAQAKEVSGLESTVLMGSDGMFSPDFVTAAGPASAGMYLTGPYVSGAAYDEFLEKHTAKFGGVPPSGFHAHAYDAANMLFQAIVTVAVPGDDGSLMIGRQALRDEMYATSGYQGLTGALTCSAIDSTTPGDCATGEALAVFQVSEVVANAPADNWPPDVVWPSTESMEDAGAVTSEATATP
jgi:branched-chain amino acid transport system substrate-binding protein